MDPLARVARSEQVPSDRPLAVSAAGRDLVLLRTARGLRAFDGRCPHQGALLAEGDLEGDALVCRNHRWRFDAATGARQGGPQCLTACPVVERGGEVLADLRPLAGRAEAGGGPRLRRVADLPGPRGLPGLGNLLSLRPSQVHRTLERWAEQHGPVYKIGLPRPTVVVASPQLCSQVLRARPETFRRDGRIATLFEEVGISGVFSAEGARWRSQRRLATEALAPRHLRSFYLVLRRVLDRLRARWHRLAERGEPVDIVEELKLFTVDVTTALAFGQDVNTLEQRGEDRIQRWLEHFFPEFNRRILAPLPLWRLVRLPRDRRLDRAVRELRAWLQDLVSEARARQDADPGRSPGNFLEATVAARDDDGEPFPDRVIFGNLVTMLLAGEDTTAYTVAWAVHELCDRPEAAQALREEADRALCQGVAPADFDTANGLSYAGAVANEAMRLRPVAPLLLMESLVDTTLGDLALPAGTSVAVLFRPAARDATHFAEPERFRPERWMETAPGAAHDPSVHAPFGGGPRLCPGRALALLEMKVVLALLYGNFEVARAGSARQVTERFSFTMVPVGLRVHLRARA